MKDAKKKVTPWSERESEEATSSSSFFPLPPGLPLSVAFLGAKTAPSYSLLCAALQQLVREKPLHCTGLVGLRPFFIESIGHGGAMLPVRFGLAFQFTSPVN